MATAVKRERTPAQGKATVGPNRPTSSAIGDRAMLAGLSIRRWHPHVTDAKVSEEVATAHKSDRSMGKYRKRLIGREAMAKIRTIDNTLRALHYFYTLPWSDEGYRILPATAYQTYRSKVDALLQERKKEVAAFLPLYPQHKAEAKKRMNGLFNESDYPGVDEIAGKFGVDVIIRPVPSGADIRVDIGDEELRRVRHEADEQLKAQLESSVRNIWERMKDVVEHASERLKAYKVEDDKVTSTFRDTLVTNIIELLDVVPMLNVMGDPNITRFAADIREGLTKHTPEVLRDDASIRSTVAARADEILSKMNSFLA